MIAAALPDPDPALPADPILATILAEVKKVAAQVAGLETCVSVVEAGPPPAAPAGNATAAGAAQGRTVNMLPGTVDRHGAHQGAQQALLCQGSGLRRRVGNAKKGVRF